ncbi:MAG: leucine-rich repeat protein [Prevotella sp.]|nr:leucine-rich repeat protein [Prevotella sp.]
MKRFLLFMLVCAIGMIVPEEMMANVYNADHLKITTSDDGKTVTIESSDASALWAFLNFGDATLKTTVINAIKNVKETGSKIVFNGIFSGDDLKALSDNGCCVQEEVDMAETTFKKHVELQNAMDAYVINTKDIHGNGGGNTPDKKLKKAAQDEGISLENGDIGVHENTFYKYNGTTWETTTEPFFVSEDRLKTLVRTTWPAPGNYAKAYVNGVLTTFQCKTDPDNGDYNDKWRPLSSDAGYDDMKFSYWGTNIKKAITSKNVTATDPMSKDMFSGCSNIVEMELKSGSFNWKLSNNVSDLPNLATLTIGKDVVKIGNDNDGFANGFPIASLTFEAGGTQDLVISNNAFEGCRGIRTNFTIPARTTSIGSSAFKEVGPNPAVAEGETPTPFVISFEDTESNPSRLSTIVGTAFHSSGITSLTIPRGVTEIQAEAFMSCFALQDIHFGETYKMDDEGKQVPLIIRSHAFDGGSEAAYKLSDVYVDVNPSVRKLICEYDAFNFTSMVGQTDPKNGQFALLHFKEDYWDYYAGDWKKGVSFAQDALAKFKDGYPDQSHKGSNAEVVSNGGKIEGMSPANGWQQFARTTTGIDIIIEEGKDFMSFSTPIVLVKPDWMHIYRITEFSDGFGPNSDASSREQADAATKAATATEILEGVEVNGKNVYCVPTNTGVIRVDNIAKDAIYYILEWNDLSASDPVTYAYNSAWSYPYKETNTGEEDKVNFLKPTTMPDREDLNIGPVVRNESGEITHRIFGFKKITKTVGDKDVTTGEFLRAKVGTTMKSQRAYLSLPASLFHWTNEWSSSSQDAPGTSIESSNSGSSKVSLIIDADFDLDFDNGIATAVRQAVEEEMYKNDSFYTLQGVKVAKPTKKGVYIHNGKKIYVK